VNRDVVISFGLLRTERVVLRARRLLTDQLTAGRGVAAG
jgi:hypothetical protein